MPILEMLRELAVVLASDEFTRDPQGSLRAWADVASERVRPTDRGAVGYTVSAETVRALWAWGFWSVEARNPGRATTRRQRDSRCREDMLG